MDYGNRFLGGVGCNGCRGQDIRMSDEKGNGHGLFMHIGGMMRCCAGSLEEYMDDGTLPTELKSEVKCKYCKEDMYLDDDGVWGLSMFHKPTMN